MVIKIIATPPGQAPEWVRKAWVGIEVQATQSSCGGIQMGIRGGAPQNLGGYSVQGNVAFAVLAEHSPRAYQWWEENAAYVFSSVLVFHRDVCEVVQE